MKLQRPSINPLLAFIAIQFTWIVVVVFWIYWFLGSHRRLRSIAEKYSPELLQPGIDWVILTEGLLLLFVHSRRGLCHLPVLASPAGP